MVRMGELAVSRSDGAVLVSIGLGSCIGLAAVDRAAGVAGLAHIMLPRAGEDRQDDDGGVAKFADRAVPALLDALAGAGAAKRRLEVALVGGAQMFTFSGARSLDIGSRNEAATREALASAGVHVHAAATSGNRGRTVRVAVASGEITVKEAGGPEVGLLSAGVSA
jgi:chemotaxis protein CheD